MIEVVQGKAHSKRTQSQIHVSEYNVEHGKCAVIDG